MAAKSKRRANTREARRQKSPSMDAEKPARASSPVRSEAVKGRNGDTVLNMRHEAGVTKKKAKSKPLSRQQRLRKEQGFKRAAAVTDQLDKKVGESKNRGRKIKERSSDWDHVNVMSGGVATVRKAERQMNKQKRKSALKQSNNSASKLPGTQNTQSGDVDAMTVENQEVIMTDVNEPESTGHITR